jgi:WD40 repeat protein
MYNDLQWQNKSSQIESCICLCHFCEFNDLSCFSVSLPVVFTPSVYWRSVMYIFQLIVFHYSSDMEIHISNICTSKTTVLTGHKAPILGVALDPKDKYVVSSINCIYQGGLFMMLMLFNVYDYIWCYIKF